MGGDIRHYAGQCSHSCVPACEESGTRDENSLPGGPRLQRVPRLGFLIEWPLRAHRRRLAVLLRRRTRQEWHRLGRATRDRELAAPRIDVTPFEARIGREW